jgi:hypothetical protein
MPQQTFKAKVKYPSGKTRDVFVKLVNFRGDPDDPEHMEIALRHANRLTPGKVTVLREGFELVDDKPDRNKIEGLKQLTNRDMQEMQTETARGPQRPTEVRGAPETRTVSRAVREQDAQKGSG